MSVSPHLRCLFIKPKMIGDTLLLTPARHDTDGFFMAVMKKG